MKLDYVVCLNRKEQKIVEDFGELADNIISEIHSDNRNEIYEKLVIDLVNGNYREIEDGGDYDDDDYDDGLYDDDDYDDSNEDYGDGDYDDDGD